jgi:hypothetical protein
MRERRCKSKMVITVPICKLGGKGRGKIVSHLIRGDYGGFLDNVIYVIKPPLTPPYQGEECMLHYQHSVAKAEKLIVVCECMRIHFFSRPVAQEGVNEYKQRTFGEMEIGDEVINYVS